MGKLGRKTVQAFCQGDENATAKVFEHYRRLIYFSISTMVDEKDEVDDVYQEVFLRLLKAKPTFESEEALATYLVKTAKTVAIDMAKSKGPIEYFDEEDCVSGKEESPSFIALDYLCPPLSAKESEIVVYKAAFSLSFREIAAIEGIHYLSVKRIYDEAIKKVRRHSR